MLGKKDIVCDVAVDGSEALESVERKNMMLFYGLSNASNGL